MTAVLSMLKTLLHPRTIRALLAFTHHGYLRDTGWLLSNLRRSPVDSEGRPIPWVTYPYLQFLEPRLRAEFDVFEFGAGHSTLYFAERVRSVTSVEHDARWASLLRTAIPRNVALLELPLGGSGAYASAAADTGKAFNLVVVDGRERNRCISSLLPALAIDAVVVLDDSERSEYEPGIAFLSEAGFRRLDFWGLPPGLVRIKCTTIFYRPGNCLGI